MTSALGTSEVSGKPFFDLDEMKQKAVEYSKGDFEISNFIIAILKDPGFWADPQNYLDKHTGRTRMTEQYIYPDDDANRFWRDYFPKS
jgi:hypothetical protein